MLGSSMLQTLPTSTGCGLLSAFSLAKRLLWLMMWLIECAFVPDIARNRGRLPSSVF
jgi:hypothetical protein